MESEGQEAQDTGQIEARYANYFKVGYNVVEFLLDFGQFYRESNREQMHTRIITSPIYARALLETLQESIDRYEHTFGRIPEHEQ